MLRTDGGDTVAKVQVREIAIPLFLAASILSKAGADPLVSSLCGTDKELGTALRSVWRDEVYGAPIPMNPNTALQIAASMFEEWAKLTGHTDRIGQYRSVSLKMLSIN